MKKTLHLTAVLLIIAGFSGLILGATYELTKEPIRQVKLTKINKYMIKWFPSVPNENKEDNATEDHPEVTDSKYVNSIYDAIDADGNLVGYVLEVKAPESYGGGMVLVVGINIDGEVLGYTYITFNESGPGAKVKSIDKFIEQFNGKSGEVYYHNDTDKNVDIISGATYTSKATINGINNALQYFNENLKVEVGADE
ncbi:FMN-binding protein [Mycoplasmatota bacterium]|nr:FMN-binding protein [Mycoplasmatota bacterium]